MSSIKFDDDPAENIPEELDGRSVRIVERFLQARRVGGGQGLGGLAFFSPTLAPAEHFALRYLTGVWPR